MSVSNATIFAPAGDTAHSWWNNILTDVAPFLTLWGERATIQLITQQHSLWSSLMLSLAPFGILTIIVAAIRVSGYAWEKYIIGRTAEPRGTVEAELLSSTSSEVCELWNGEQVVRIVGQGDIIELIHMLPKDPSVLSQADPSAASAENAAGSVDAIPPSSNPAAPIPESNAAADQAPEPSASSPAAATTAPPGATSTPGGPSPARMLPAVRRPLTVSPMAADTSLPGELELQEQLGVWQYVKALPQKLRRFAMETCERWLRGPHPEPEVNIELGPAGQDQSVSIIVKTQPMTPANAAVPAKHGPPAIPSILLNMFKMPALYNWSLCFTLLSILQGVVFAVTGWGLTTHVQVFLAEGNETPIPSFITFILGVVGLVLGTGILAHVIDKGSKEYIHKPAKGRQARPVYLQRKSVVNDQHFQSFAIFSQSICHRIISSFRVEKPSRRQQLLAFFGVLITAVSWLSQLMSQRHLGFVVSAMQLSLTLFAMLVKMILNRSFMKLPKTISLPAGHELDWYSTHVANRPEKAPWIDPLADRSDDWTWEVHRITDPSNCLEFVKEEPPPSAANNVVLTRQHLGRWSIWRSTASDTAVKLARAIEATLNHPIVRDRIPPRSVWWPVKVGTSEVFLHLRHGEGHRPWRVSAGALDAFLSLQLYHMTNPEQNNAPEPSQSHHVEEDDSWLRGDSDDGRENLYLAAHWTLDLAQEISWFMRRDALVDRFLGKLVAIRIHHEPSRDASEATALLGALRKTEATRVTGQLKGYKIDLKSVKNVDYSIENFDAVEGIQGDWKLAVVQQGSQCDLLATQLFGQFMRSLAKSLTRPLFAVSQVCGDITASGADVQTGRMSSLGGASAVRSMIQDVQDTGLASWEEILTTMIPPLLEQEKLPRCRDIMQENHRRVSTHLRKREWLDAMKACLAFDHLPMNLNKGCLWQQVGLTVSVLLVVYEQANQEEFTLIEEWRRKDTRKVVWEMIKHKHGLEQIAAKFDASNVFGQMPQYLLTCSLPARHRLENIIAESHNSSFHDTDVPAEILGLSKVHDQSAEGNVQGLRQALTENPDAVSQMDALGCTPLHHAALLATPDTVNSLLSLGASKNIDAVDFLGRTALHMTCFRDLGDITECLVAAGCDLDITDAFGRTALDYAKGLESGHVANVLARHGASSHSDEGISPEDYLDSAINTCLNLDESDS